MTSVERRAFMKGAALGALAFTVGGVEVLLTPGEARAQGVPLPRCSRRTRPKSSRRMGETLVPGAREAGIAHFIDQQMLGAAGRGAARGAHHQRAPALREFLSRRDRRDRPRAAQRQHGTQVRRS